MGHVVEDVLHCAAMRKSARPHLPISLLPALALVCMKQQDQLLLDQFAFLWVSCGARRCHRHTSAASHGDHRCLLLRLLLELLLIDEDEDKCRKKLNKSNTVTVPHTDNYLIHFR